MERKPVSRSLNYLYEDDFLIAVDKPVGLAVIAPEGSRAKSLYDIVTDRIRRRNPKGRAAVVHRIDRDTSGIVLFAKDARSKKILMDNWDSMVLERGYLAVVKGRMEAPSGRIESYLAENRGGEVYETKESTRGAKLAVTDYALLKEGPRASLLEIKLQTGRKHQIRVQLASRGHPVLGDPKYGDWRSAGADRLCLHAALMRFIHPKDKCIILLESPMPASFTDILMGGKNLRRGA